MHRPAPRVIPGDARLWAMAAVRSAVAWMVRTPVTDRAAFTIEVTPDAIGRHFVGRCPRWPRWPSLARARAREAGGLDQAPSAAR